MRGRWFKERFQQHSLPTSEPERLGSVSTASGELLLIDFGNLTLWSGDAPPVVAEGLLDEGLTESMNQAVDYEIVGRDATAAAELMNLAVVHGVHAFDVPRDARALPDALAAVRAERGLDADLHVIDRMPHRERVRALLDRIPAGVEVPFHGLWAVAARGFPVGRDLPVCGERMDADGPDRGRWRSVWIQAAEGAVVASEPIGYVLVDRARLMFADPDALPAWNLGSPEGKRWDLVFWGRDAEAVAGHLSAARFDEGGQVVFGWRDRTYDDVRELGVRLRAHMEGTSARIAKDFRPHDDDHRILAAMRESPTESASVDVAGLTVCGFFTSWGDGAFPVHRDLDAESRLLRIRVELGAPEIVVRTRRMEELWFGSLSKLAIASPAVARGGSVRWLERDAPRDERDSGWCVYTGTETQEELDEAGSATLMPLRDLIRTQPDLEPLLSSPAPAAFELAEDGTWRAIPGSRD